MKQDGLMKKNPLSFNLSPFFPSIYAAVVSLSLYNSVIMIHDDGSEGKRKEKWMKLKTGLASIFASCLYPGFFFLSEKKENGRELFHPLFLNFRSVK